MSAPSRENRGFKFSKNALPTLTFGNNPPLDRQPRDSRRMVHHLQVDPGWRFRVLAAFARNRKILNLSFAQFEGKRKWAQDAMNLAAQVGLDEWRLSGCHELSLRQPWNPVRQSSL